MCDNPINFFFTKESSSAYCLLFKCAITALVKWVSVKLKIISVAILLIKPFLFRKTSQTITTNLKH